MTITIDGIEYLTRQEVLDNLGISQSVYTRLIRYGRLSVARRYQREREGAKVGRPVNLYYAVDVEKAREFAHLRNKDGKERLGYNAPFESKAVDQTVQERTDKIWRHLSDLEYDDTWADERYSVPQVGWPRDETQLVELLEICKIHELLFQINRRRFPTDHVPGPNLDIYDKDDLTLAIVPLSLMMYN